MISRLAFVAGLLCLPAAALAAGPVVTWASDPVRPDETVLVLGGGFGTDPVVEVGRLRDAKSAGMVELWSLVESPAQIKPLQVGAHSLKFVLPAALRPGCYAFRVRAGGAVSRPAVLNSPDVWWLQGDEGRQATPGGWVRLFGKCLATGGKTQVRLQPAGGGAAHVLAATGDGYGARVALPADLPAGDYRVQVHNGCLGALGWAPAGSLTVIAPVRWKQDVFPLADFPGPPAAAMQAALDKAKANGGGVVLVPRGRWEMSGSLSIPPGTVVKGAGREASTLYWGDLKEVPPALISGADFGLQDLTIYAQGHRCVIADQRESTRLRLTNLRVRATGFFMLGQPGGAFRGRTAPAELGEGTLLRITAPNFQVTHCDFYDDGSVLSVDPHGFVGERGPWFGVISDNRVRYGRQGFMFEGVDGLIFENNDVSGDSPAAGGNAINTFWNNFARNVYFGRNRIHDIYGWDREMTTLDAGGGAYFGKVAGVDGTRLTLAGDPAFMDYRPAPHHTDYRGAVAMILDGTGAGQYRTVTANQGREWEVDRPWDIPPDDTSVVSIAPFRGRHIFEGNDYSDGGAFQLYGAALDTLVVGNKGRRMDGFFAWGLNPHGWGWHPAWRCQFLDNEIVEGNGFGGRSAFLGAITGDNNDTYAGPLARAIVLRRNKLDSNARIRFQGTVEDAVVEHCAVRDADQGIEIRKPARGILLRRNTFENVGTPVAGDGAGDAEKR